MVQRGRSPGVAGPGLYGGAKTSPARLVALAAALLAVVVLVIFVFGRVCGGGCSDLYCASDQEIAAPGGFEFASDLYQLDGEPPAGGSTLQLSVPLRESSGESDNRSLAFFGYNASSGEWEPLGPAQVVEDGEGEVRGTLSTSPQFLAVMRRLSKAGHVVAYLDAGAALHGEAAGRVTMVHTRDFTPQGDGALAGTATQVTRDPSFQFVPTVSASAEDGLQVVTALLGTGSERSRHVQRIVEAVDAASADGIDIAYLDLPTDQRSTFTLFVIELAQALHGRGKLLTLTLPLPASSGGSFDEGAYDWAELAKHADLLQVLPYRDGGDYRLVVPGLLEYLTSRADPARLVMTVTPYASEKAADGALRTLTVVEAMTIATQISVEGDPVEVSNNYSVVGVNIDKARGRSGVSWAPETATVFFTYEQAGGRTIYIENVYSVGFKLEYIPRYRLGGVAVEDASANPLLGNIWPALTPFIETGEPVLSQPFAADLAPRWDTSGGELDQDNRGAARWTAPADPGPYTISLTLSDGVALFKNEITVNVQPRAQPGTASGG